MTDFPKGYLAITPYFTTPDADAFIAFVKTVFGATLVKENRYETGRIQHAHLSINGAAIMLNEATKAYPSNVSQMHLYVDDVPKMLELALANNATTIMDVNTRPHGDQMAGFTDPSGNIWWIASKIG
ncbi:MAG: VOC family protein [Amylibacter sp.]